MTSDDDMRRLAEAATPGPLTVVDGQFGSAVYSGTTSHGPNTYASAWRAADAAFIAAASPETVLALLDRVAAAEAEAADLTADLADARATKDLHKERQEEYLLRAHRAENEAIDLRQVMASERAHMGHVLAENAALRATVERVREALSYNPVCDVHPDDDVITCGWKRAVADVQGALDDTTSRPEERA